MHIRTVGTEGQRSSSGLSREPCSGVGLSRIPSQDTRVRGHTSHCPYNEGEYYPTQLFLRLRFLPF